MFYHNYYMTGGCMTRYEMEQMERIRGRHEGSENAVDMMKVGSTCLLISVQI